MRGPGGRAALRRLLPAALLAPLLVPTGCGSSSPVEEPPPAAPPVSEVGRSEVPPGQPARTLDLPPSEEPDPSAEPASEAGDAAESGWRTAAGSRAECSVRWRPAGGEVPRNREFELEVELSRGGEPLSGERLQVRGWMPDHSHGLVRQPEVTDLGDGRYRVTNLLLHMRGLWQLLFDVGEGAEHDTVVFEIRL